MGGGMNEKGRSMSSVQEESRIPQIDCLKLNYPFDKKCNNTHRCPLKIWKTRRIASGSSHII